MHCLVVRVKGIYYGRQHLWVQLSGLIQRISLVSSMDLLACLTLKKFSLGSTHPVTLTKSFGRIEEFVIHNHITRMLLENSIQPREILGISQRNSLAREIFQRNPPENFSVNFTEKFWVQTWENWNFSKYQRNPEKIQSEETKEWIWIQCELWNLCIVGIDLW